MEQQQQNNLDDLDDIINSALEDFEELERTGHFDRTTTTTSTTTNSSTSGNTHINSLDFTRFVQTFEKLSQQQPQQTHQQENTNTKPPEPGTNKSDDDLIDQMLKDFDGNAGYQGLVQGMMKQLLAKEVLYEPMKEMRDKYPQWLKENRQKMAPAEYTKYLRQYNHIEEILFTYDKEGDEGFEKVLKLMREMQECGHVPSEIVKQLAPDVEFDEEGQPKFPGMEALGNMDLAQCSIL
eukprot:TRINITY_DN1026_c0_g1_i1.p1 TRINITY_DN1026_c0_g1~~TRINITY_DN1026_c0_g1_i1.p1  ORF type:complete len:237 (-),score=66.57 TRINITY_DN1026_c0_g1_i1:79-789(-)